MFFVREDDLAFLCVQSVREPVVVLVCCTFSVFTLTDQIIPLPRSLGSINSDVH